MVIPAKVWDDQNKTFQNIPLKCFHNKSFSHLHEELALVTVVGSMLFSLMRVGLWHFILQHMMHLDTYSTTIKLGQATNTCVAIQCLMQRNHLVIKFLELISGVTFSMDINQNEKFLIYGPCTNFNNTFVIRQCYFVDKIINYFIIICILIWKR